MTEIASASFQNEACRTGVNESLSVFVKYSLSIS
jgi:hypothetical protein